MALFEAIFDDNLEEVQKLIKEGVDVNRQHDRYGNPLIAAARSGIFEIVEALLNAGANPNLLIIDQPNALSAAIFAQSSIPKGAGNTEYRINGRKKIIKLLVEKGADVNDCGSTGILPPLYYSLKANPDPELVSFLLKKGANPRLRCYRQKNALDYYNAQRNKNPEILNMLCKAIQNTGDIDDELKQQILQASKAIAEQIVTEALKRLEITEIHRSIGQDETSRFQNMKTFEAMTENVRGEMAILKLHLQKTYSNESERESRLKEETVKMQDKYAKKIYATMLNQPQKWQEKVSSKESRERSL